MEVEPTLTRVGVGEGMIESNPLSTLGELEESHPTMPVWRLEEKTMSHPAHSRFPRGLRSYRGEIPISYRSEGPSLKPENLF